MNSTAVAKKFISQLMKGLFKLHVWKVSFSTVYTLGRSSLLFSAIEYLFFSCCDSYFFHLLHMRRVLFSAANTEDYNLM
jgi:hypothetical protein